MKTLEQLVDAYGLEWEAFTDVLDAMERDAFVGLMHHAKQHAEAGSTVEDLTLFESVVMSILVEHQKELSQLQEWLLPVETKTCPRCNRTSSIEDFRKSATGDVVGILCHHCREALCFMDENR
jgi:hypothetical protein